MRFFLLVIVLAAGARADEVVTQVLSNQVLLGVSQKTETWNLETAACVYRDKEKIACGIIVQKAGKGVVLRVLDQTKVARLGDNVRSEGFRRGPASISGLEDTASLKTAKRIIVGGAHVGLKATLYNVHFQGLISDHVSLGLQPGLFTFNDTGVRVTSFGAVFSAHYYSKGPFEGLWLQGASGFYAFRAESGDVLETSYSPAIIATVGWRGMWELGMTIGLGLGAQYIANPQRSSVTIPFSAIQPVFAMDIGLPL